MPRQVGRVLVALLAATPVALAQAQERRTVASSSAEAQLMGYYAAVMQFTPVGLPDAAGRWEIGGTLGYIPDLPLEDRTVGFGGTKTEGSNLCAVFPRLVASRSFGRLGLEAGWTPPLQVCGVQANIGALAASWRFAATRTWDARVRGSAVFGSLEAPITCTAAATENPDDLTCFGGHPSNDQVSPLSAALDAIVGWQGLRERGLEPYLLLGVRREQVHFDVNYTRDPGTQLPPLDDHQQLGTTLTRMHAAAGLTFAGPGRVRLGGELYYAPDALFTVRGRASVALGSAR